ncbi:hypothetical protein [Humisphaera borealis]|uniref:Uncharacterized protein n=1 Tax=Humisphaera borealis TaxID=2807512 RepID=A0A7M2X1X5_9BACT|nr:hypothetical protein [Humisphaera borealis]QOV90740.1 hypothetical protein IPV69_05110 [Humisphaera borealis]
MRLHFRFIGGPQDGKTLPVPSPVTGGMEISVRPVEPYLPCATYTLGDDGFFRFSAVDLTDATDDLECCQAGS